MRLLLEELGTVDPSHGDLAGPDDEAVVWLAREVAAPLHAPVVAAVGAPQLNAEPGALLKVYWPNVPDDAFSSRPIAERPGFHRNHHL